MIEDFEKMIDDDDKEVRQSATEGLISFAEFTEGIDVILDKKKILPHLVNKLIEEKIVHILENIVILLKNLMQGEIGTVKALET